MPVRVPNLIGLARAAAEAQLDALLLRHIGQFPFAAAGDGSATAQSPPAGTLVPTYTVVTVAYPSPLGPLADTPVEGPSLPAGTYDGTVRSVMVGDPWGSGQGAWIDLDTQLDDGAARFTAALYFDHAVNPGPPPERTEWMRRGAMLGLAQRAFADSLPVRVVTTADLFVQSIEIRRP